MRQTLAIFLDAYRELNNRRLFWMVLVLSGLVVVIMAMFGINERGITFLRWSLDFGPNTAIMSRDFFYKQVMFVGLGIKFWLAWIATVLALVSTAGMIPDFISSGSIDLALCKPITRLRLFLTKYFAGLLFVALQVFVFAGLAFVVIGWRSGSWEPRILLAIPLVVAFFSYLFCICTLLGMITRSGIASLLLTLLVWAVCFLITIGGTTIAMGKAYNDQRTEVVARKIEAKKKEIADLEARNEKGAANVMNGAVRIPLAKSNLQKLEEKSTEIRGWKKVFDRLDTGAYVVKTVLPKMSETKDLLERVLLSDADRKKLVKEDDQDQQDMVVSDDPDVPVDGKKVQRQVVERKLSEPVWWILGTSFGFEAVILGIATIIFVRRDF